MDEDELSLPQQDETAPSGAPIAVLAKAFNVLETMAEMGEAAPLRDIAKATGLPKGTLFRILQTLAGLGYVGQSSETGYYNLTGQLAYLGRNAQAEDLKMLLLPNMRSLSEKFNETVNLGVLDGLYVYYLSVIEARRNLSWSVPPGSRDVYYATALGRAIVANLPEEKREALLKQTTLRSRTQRTVMNRSALIQILEDAAQEGVAFDAEENDDGVICLGTPVFVDGRVVAAISISVPTNRYSEALGKDIRAAFKTLDFNFKSARSA